MSQHTHTYSVYSRVFLLLTLLLAGGGTCALHAGIYSPQEPFNFEFDENGIAQPMQFANGFELAYKTLRNVATDTSKTGISNPDRREVEQRVAQRLQIGPGKLDSEELAGLTADMLRLSQPDRVLNMLQPLARDPRRSDYFVLSHLARAHQARGTELREAFEQQQLALRGVGFPSKFARMNRNQLQWLKKVESEYTLALIANRIDESDRNRGSKRGELTEAIDPLFPPSPPRRNRQPVQFVGESGSYEVGAIAASEKAKLPPDALAVMQQLVLWYPTDTRLYWQLGELYNAFGEPEIALKILDDCAFNMGYSHPTLLEHRRILKPAVELIQTKRAEEAAQQKQQEENEKEEAARLQRERQQRFWWIVSIVTAFAILLLYFQFRELLRRLFR